MALLPTPIVDYTDLDFDSIRARLYNLVGAAFPDWTEQSVANFGNLLIELMSHVGDVLGFYLDARARESRLTQATLRASVVSVAKLLGYVPSGATAAQTDVVLSVPAVIAHDVLIPAGTGVRTLLASDPITFQTLADQTLAAGALSVTVQVEHSKSFAETFPATGLANQEVQLQNTPFLDGSEAVVANNGFYTRVDNFLLSTGNDLQYTLTVDQRDRALLRFGNGTNGQIPTGTISVSYKTGGGAEGNVEPNSLRKIDGTLVDTAGNLVQLSVTNPERAAGGGPRKSVRQIQLEAPAQLRALTRTVAREDYEINAKRVPQVARALMLTSDEVPGIQENTGLLYIVPVGGGTPAASVLEAVHEMVTITYPNTITFQVTPLAAAYFVVNLQATVFPRKGVANKALDAVIRANLAQHFALTLDPGTENERDNPAMNFGFYASQTTEGAFDGTLALSDLMNVVRDTTGVRKLGDGINDFLVNGAHRDVKVQAHQFPRLGTVTLLNGETKAPLA